MDSLMTNWRSENLVDELEQIYFSPNSEVCMVVNRHNKTIITNAYEGIPETLILNLVAWVFLFMLFTLLRQQAWDYGRLALVNSFGDKKRWTQIFYGDNNNENNTKTINEDSTVSSTTGVGTSTAHAAATTSTGQIILNNNNSQPSINNIDNGYLSWIWLTIKLTPEQIMKQCGPDAVHYLSFQKHLIFVMSVITIISLAIILPINFQGTLSGDVNSFGHTTISNLNPKSNLLWIHVFIAICYVPLVVLVMRRSSGRNSSKTASTCTIMITNINKKDCNKQTIDTYIKELFPDVVINDIQLAYNIAKLVNIANEYEKVIEARMYCEKHKNYKVIKIKKHNILCCLNKNRNDEEFGNSINEESSESLDALEYYKRKEIKLYGEVIRLKASALNEPLGIAFVTVQTTLIAKNIIKYYRPSTYRDWTLTYAPSPSDLFWENLSVNSTHWYIKWFFVNLILFLFLFFLTTPVLIVNIVDALTISKNTTEVISKINPLISEFLPTLLLWTLSALMPVIVAYSDKWLSHWTRSKQNYSIMTKTFGYLLFMILILPSLGLTSAQAFIEWTIHYNDNTTYRWECIFLPDKGAFFVNYIITAAFIGTSLELIRFPELIVYLWSLLSTKSQAENVFVRRNILIEYPFGIHYAWTVMVFTMSTVYSIACPLIMPFAMVYILLKHFVDRHNLYFAYSPSNMISQGGGKIHSSAVTMTKISVILLLIITAALASVRGGKLADPRAIVLIIAIVITLGLFAFMSPIKKCTTRPPTINEPHGPPPIYIADVLLNEYHLNEMSSLRRCEYGSDSNSEMVNITASESEQDLSSVRPIIDA